MKYTFLLILGLVALSATADDDTAIRELIRNDDVSEFRRLFAITEDELFLRSEDSVEVLGFSVAIESNKIFGDIVARYPNYARENSSKALTLACASNRKDRFVIEKLIDLGVDINSLNSWGANCLYSAVISADQSFFAYLVAKGADPAIKVRPDKVFGHANEVSIEQLVVERHMQYQEMRNHITSLTKRR